MQLSPRLQAEFKEARRKIAKAVDLRVALALAATHREAVHASRSIGQIYKRRKS